MELDNNFSGQSKPSYGNPGKSSVDRSIPDTHSHNVTPKYMGIHTPDYGSSQAIGGAAILPSEPLSG